MDGPSGSPDGAYGSVQQRGTGAAPRGQLPYIDDDGEAIGDSDAIIAHLTRKYYSRWKDEQFWPAFRDALRREHPSLTEAGLRKAREFNSQRYHYQGIGRFAPAAAYARGLADLRVLANLIPASGYLHGPEPTSSDAAIYGFIANILFYAIDTPLRQFVAAHPNLVRHCTAIHAAIGSPAPA